MVALNAAELRYDWAVAEIEAFLTLSLPELIFRAQTIHRTYHPPDEVQGCVLLSIKTGGCPEDCAYCPQSARYQTGVAPAGLLTVEETLQAAEHACRQGATRFCMGAAWRDVPDGKDFERVLEMVRGVRALGLEACCTLGMLTDEQAEGLATAGLTAYNHNLDTSQAFYEQIITTRTYDERLQTLARVRRAGIMVCCGGIIGMGEGREDRCHLLAQLASQQPHPESVPINLLVRVEGTPLADERPLDPLELVRMIATARILMPASMVRLSAGRLSLSDEAQALCFLAGANSIFMGERLLTTPNPEIDHDQRLLDKLGMRLRSQGVKPDGIETKSRIPEVARPRRDEMEQRVRHRLAELDAAGLRRHLRPPAGVDLSSNDYLGLATHPVIKQRMTEAVLREGCGSTASRLLRGERACFAAVERRFAEFKGTEAALLFGSGYAANIAVLSTFLEAGDVVFSDELNHASLIDGMRLGRARRVIFPHGDIEALRRLLEAEHCAGQRFLVTESLFSMEGNVAPLAEYAALCRTTGAALIVDEAHAVGIYGPRGSGLIEATDIEEDVFLSVNTAGKALGVGGAFVAGPSWAIEYLVQRARPFVFSTAPPPAMAAAIDAALTVVAEEPERRTQLLERAARLRHLLADRGVAVLPGRSQILPVIVGDNARSIAVAATLQMEGFDVRAIRPPTVPPGTARLRVAVNVNLDDTLLNSFAAALVAALAETVPCPKVSF